MNVQILMLMRLSRHILKIAMTRVMVGNSHYMVIKTVDCRVCFMLSSNNNDSKGMKAFLLCCNNVVPGVQ